MWRSRFVALVSYSRAERDGFARAAARIHVERLKRNHAACPATRMTIDRINAPTADMRVLKSRTLTLPAECVAAWSWLLPMRWDFAAAAGWVGRRPLASQTATRRSRLALDVCKYFARGLRRAGRRRRHLGRRCGGRRRWLLGNSLASTAGRCRGALGASWWAASCKIGSRLR